MTTAAYVPDMAVEIIQLAIAWRKAQPVAGHAELNTLLAALGQACDRYLRAVDVQ